MSLHKEAVLFSLDQKKYGVGSEYFVRAIRTVGITSIPKLPKTILGVINFHGKIIPVINVREKLGLPERPLLISDQMIILHTSQKTFAIVVDEINGFLDNLEMTLSENISEEIDNVDGVIKVDGEVIAITKVEKLFMQEDEEAIINSDEEKLVS